jgi:hypothetical protein
MIPDEALLMAIDALDVRMARLEGGYEQITERLGAIEHRLTSFEERVSSEIKSLRAEMATMRAEMATRSDVDALRVELRSEVRAGDSELRRQLNAQFYWLLTFILGSILVPILRDLAR